MTTAIGGAWLIEQFGLPLAQPLAVRSEVGSRRATRIEDGVRRESYGETMRPEASLRGHLTFHLKHEVPNLELLVRLFETQAAQGLASWFLEEPSGQYARRACFLYEWLTGRQLPLAGATQGAYVDALNGEAVVVASPGKAAMSRRWRVRDNLPGTPAFCPIVRKTPETVAAMHLDIPRLLGDLAREFGADVVMKSAVWMTLRESKSSFVIEGEGGSGDRIQRFASVLGSRTGTGEIPLTEVALAQLQGAILGERSSLRLRGLRRSPVFVGESVHFQEVVHYIAPPAQDLQAMLQGLIAFLDRTQGQAAIMRAAVAAFGFVYIHPLADGNGRVHRFLVNDLLRRDGVVQAPLILPLSALITSDPAERRAYDATLETVSRPLMNLMAGRYRFGKPQLYPDGITSNLEVDEVDSARPVWRMPDLTRHTIYLSDVVGRTVRDDMRQESWYLRSHASARSAVKDVMEMPDAQIDRVIRSIEANQGRLTAVLADEIPALAAEGVWPDIVAAVRAAFQSNTRK